MTTSLQPASFDLLRIQTAATCFGSPQSHPANASDSIPATSIPFTSTTALAAPLLELAVAAAAFAVTVTVVTPFTDPFADCWTSGYISTPLEF